MMFVGGKRSPTPEASHAQASTDDASAKLDPVLEQPTEEEAKVAGKDGKEAVEEAVEEEEKSKNQPFHYRSQVKGKKDSINKFKSMPELY